MTKHLLSFLGASLLAACVAGPDISSKPEGLSDNACPDNVPATIAPAADQDLDFRLYAVGVQIYQCSTAGAWVFSAPDALLYADAELTEHVGHHYLTTGPTWEYEDGSLVVAKKAAGATPDPSAIPWLLLVSTGHNYVAGRMSDVTSIQRLETTFGTAPAGSCTPGDIANVPYTATYFFYRTKTNNEAHNTRCGA